MTSPDRVPPRGNLSSPPLSQRQPLRGVLLFLRVLVAIFAALFALLGILGLVWALVGYASAQTLPPLAMVLCLWFLPIGFIWAAFVVVISLVLRRLDTHGARQFRIADTVRRTSEPNQ